MSNEKDILARAKKSASHPRKRAPLTPAQTRARAKNRRLAAWLDKRTPAEIEVIDALIVEVPEDVIAREFGLPFEEVRRISKMFDASGYAYEAQCARNRNGGAVPTHGAMGATIGKGPWCRGLGLDAGIAGSAFRARLAARGLIPGEGAAAPRGRRGFGL